MRDDRWRDVVRALESMDRFLSEAVQLLCEGGLSGRDRASFHRQMALMHMMEVGYTSFETALVRTMNVLDESPPSGADWHAQLIARAAEELPGRRPPILTPALAKAARKVKDFRHWATRGYDVEFAEQDARSAVEAAEALLVSTRGEIERFIAAIDP